MYKFDNKVYLQVNQNKTFENMNYKSKQIQLLSAEKYIMYQI